MKDTGIIRTVDDMGRIVIPKELRRQLDMEVATDVEIFTDGESIILKRCERLCAFCGGEAGLVTFKGKLLCADCVAELKKSF